MVEQPEDDPDLYNDHTNSVFHTEDVKLKIDESGKYINEFKILENIGRGSYSKVKKIVRQFKEEDGHYAEEAMAMKMMHKPTLNKERAIRYNTSGEMEIIHNLDRVYKEIEVWAMIRHPNVIRLYELVDSDDHDYMYLIMELADKG